MKVVLRSCTIKGLNILNPLKNEYLGIPYLLPKIAYYQSDVTGQNNLVLRFEGITLYIHLLLLCTPINRNRTYVHR